MTAPDGRPFELSVVIVNWNSGPWLARALASIRRHPPSVPYEVVVVDNASTDASTADLGPGPVRLIRNPSNRGLAAANNQGLRATGGPLVLVANPDIELTAGAVDALAAVMARHERAAFVVPRLVGPDGAPQTSAGDLPRLGQALLPRRLAHRAHRTADPTSGFWWDGWDHSAERPIGRGAEACYLVRRAAVDDFGPQDERFPLDWEGIEWTARARAAGWEVWLAPNALVRHAGGVSISSAGVRWVVQSHLGMYRYFAPRLPRAARPALAAVVGGRALLKAGARALGLPLYRWARRGPARPELPACG